MRTRKKDSLDHGLVKNQMVICGLHMYHFKEYHETLKEYCRIGTTLSDDPVTWFMVKIASLTPYHEEDFPR